ncbi:short chain dehydrogenase [compost metagenome]
MDGKQDGDPAKAALAIIAVIDAERPPLHLPLHPSALSAYCDILDKTLEQLEDWREVSEGILFD